jgi:hypothetical protein
MKKLLCLVLGCVLLCASFGAIAEVAPTEAPTVVRGVKWGMTAEEIIALEGREPDLRGDDTLIFQFTKVGELLADLTYGLDEDGTCVGVVYNFINDYEANYDGYIADYISLNDALTRKYGKPILDEEIWLANTYRKNPAQYGLAIAAGELEYRAEFETEDTHITLQLNGRLSSYGSSYIYLRILYMDKAFEVSLEPTPMPETLGTPRRTVELEDAL